MTFELIFYYCSELWIKFANWNLQNLTLYITIIWVTTLIWLSIKKRCKIYSKPRVSSKQCLDFGIVIKVTHKRFFCVLTYGCSTSSSFSSGILQDLILGSGLSLQNHFSGSLFKSVPSGSFRHFRQSGLSHCAQLWSGRCLKFFQIKTSILHSYWAPRVHTHVANCASQGSLEAPNSNCYGSNQRICSYWTSTGSGIGSLPLARWGPFFSFLKWNNYTIVRETQETESM